MAILNERIKERRQALGLTLLDVAEELNVKEATAQRYESGQIKNIKHETIVALSRILRCSPAYLMGWTDKATGSTRGVPIPVLGRVAAGIPIEAVEDVIDTEEITEELAKTGKFFGLKIHGSSMEPRMCEGDVVIVRCQDDAESGDIVIASINGDDATCKRLKKYSDGIALISNNPAYEPFYFSSEDIEKTPVRILGKVVELRGKL